MAFQALLKWQIGENSSGLLSMGSCCKTDLGKADKLAWDHPSGISYTTASHECTHTHSDRSREEMGEAKAGEHPFLAGY